MSFEFPKNVKGASIKSKYQPGFVFSAYTDLPSVWLAYVYVWS